MHFFRNSLYQYGAKEEQTHNTSNLEDELLCEALAPTMENVEEECPTWSDSIFCSVNDFIGIIFGLHRIQLDICSARTSPIFGSTSLKMTLFSSAPFGEAAVMLSSDRRLRERIQKFVNYAQAWRRIVDVINDW